MFWVLITRVLPGLLTFYHVILEKEPLLIQFV